MLAASSGISSIAGLSHKLRGLEGIKSLKELDKQLDDEHKLSELSRKLERIHTELKNTETQLLIIGDEDNYKQYIDTYNGLWSSKTGSNEGDSEFSLPSISKKVRQLWVANTQVNFSSAAYPAVTINHPDAPAFTVLGEYLRNGYLHRAIREQGGAYGSGASYDSNSASFRFYSYRDPRITETLADFEHSIDWLMDKDHEWRELEESILGVISGIDKPRSPSGEAKDVFHSSLYGRTPEQRREFREKIMNVTYDDLARICSVYLTKDNISIAVLTNESRTSELLDFNMDIAYV
jgi:Zn-dependent M16 (insulinase) family peptidase